MSDHPDGWDRRAARQLERAAPLIADLVAGRRSWESLTVREARLLRGLPQVELHLAQAQALRFEDPAGMLAAARLARNAAHGLSHRAYRPQTIADARARAWAELGNAWRVNDDLDRAEEVMRRALCYLVRGSGEPRLEARVLELCASLFCDQRWFADAFDVLGRVVQIYRELGDEHLAGRTLITMSHYAACDGEPEAALQLLAEGFPSIDPERDPVLGPIALQNMICYAVDIGFYRLAQRLLWRARMARLLPEGAVAQLKLHWAEARIHVGLGQLERAEREFQESWDGLEALGYGFDAGIAALDLAGVWMRQGREEEVMKLASGLVNRFRALGIRREATAAVAEVRRAYEQRRLTLEVVEDAAAYLRKLERTPDVPLPPPR